MHEDRGCDGMERDGEGGQLGGGDGEGKDQVALGSQRVRPVLCKEIQGRRERIRRL